MKDRGCVSDIAIGLPFGIFYTLYMESIGRWGIVAFWVLLICVLVVSVVVLRTEQFEPYWEKLSEWLPLLIGGLVGGMGAKLNLPFWQIILILAASIALTGFVFRRIRSGRTLAES